MSTVACISVDGCRENLSGALASAHDFDLPNPVSKESMAMIHIRPHQIFSMGDNFDEPYQAFLPPNYSGSLLALETVVFVKLLKHIKPERIFEFGTYRGDTTRLMLENLSPAEVYGERIYTLDIDSLEGIRFQGDDQKLAAISMLHPRKYLKSKSAHLVCQILQDSLYFDPSPYLEKFQFVFVDANHEYQYVRKDTENGLSMLSREGSAMIWHDYGNPQFPELTAYLDELSREIPHYHVEETMFVVHLRGFKIPGRASGVFFNDRQE